MRDAGASLFLLEAVPKEVGELITKELDVPVYGIGAGPEVDGQLVIFHDLVGLFWDFKPRFVKQYVNTEEIISNVLKHYSSDVSKKLFPSAEHCYDMNSEELEKMLKMKSSSWKYT
jgi:3-methyl-2-oxobutanoate hydroxymethyltransferase